MTYYNNVFIPPYNTRARTAPLRVTVGDADYTIKSYERIVALTTNLTSFRVWTLPAANSVPDGTAILLVDETGSVSNTNLVSIAASGSDNIDGSLAASATNAYFCVLVISDGASKWTYDRTQTGTFDKIRVRDFIVSGIGSAVFFAGVDIEATLYVSSSSEFQGNATFDANATVAGVLTANGNLNTNATLNLNSILAGGNTSTNYAVSTAAGISPRAGNNSFADDDALIITLPGANSCVVHYVCATAPSATAPTGSFLIRHGSATAPVQLSCTDATNIVYGTAVLSTGTSNGTDGALNINNPGNGKLYFKNRLGATRNYGFAITGYI